MTKWIKKYRIKSIRIQFKELKNQDTGIGNVMSTVTKITVLPIVTGAVFKAIWEEGAGTCLTFGPVGAQVENRKAKIPKAKN